MRNAEQIVLLSGGAAGFWGRTNPLSSAFRVPRLGGVGMRGGVWLAIDTATDIASVAAGRGPAPAAGAHVQGARRHAAEIIRLIHFTPGRLGLAPRDLAGTAVGDG